MLPLLLMLLAPARALTLDQAWTLALDEGTDARMIERQVDLALVNRGYVASQLLPRVMVSGGYTLNEVETAVDFAASLPPEMAALVGDMEPIVINEKAYWSGNLSVVQPLFSVSALSGLRTTESSIGAARAQAQASRAQLRLGVAQAYWGAWLARQQLALAEDAARRAEELDALARARQEVGAGSALDTAQAGVALARARRERIQAQAGRVRAEEALGRLLGVDADVPLEPPPPQDPGLETVEQAVQAALSSPALRAAEGQATAARQARTAIDLGWLPTVSGRFTEAWSQNSGFSDKEWNWQVAVTADWNLFDGGYRIAREVEFGHQAALARLAAEKERATVEADARSLWAELQAAREGLVQAEQEKALAEQALSIAETSYGLGAITFFDLWQARQARDGASLGFLAARMQVDLAALGLRARVGEG